MKLFSLILQDLYSHCIGNKIYSFNDTEKDYYERIKAFVEKQVKESENSNSPYIDIMLDFSDYSIVQPLFDEDNDEMEDSKRKRIKINRIYDYLKYSILAKIKTAIGSDNEFFDDSLKDLHEGDPVWDTFPDNMFFEGVGSIVNSVDGYLRVHIFLDEVDDVELQVAINNFLVENQFAFMCYTAKELSTYMSTKGESITVSGTVEFVRSDKEEIAHKKRIKERFVVIEEELK